MDWSRHIDIYCERIDPSYWSEPLNALTNLAFLISAAIMWRRSRGDQDALARALCAVLACIGVGSFLFHTHATPWSALADVLPIAAFVLLYLYAANRRVLGLSAFAAAASALAVLPYSFAAGQLFASLPFFKVSAAYWPLVPLIVAYAALAARTRPGSGLAAGWVSAAGVLCLSLAARTLDEPLCEIIPVGTHFLWHILNAIVLGWMIEVYRRQNPITATPANAR